MLSNSIAAALLGAAYVVVLVLDLNPTLPLNPSRLQPLVLAIGGFYTMHLTVIFYFILVLRQILARTLFSPAWVSVGVLVWLGAAAALGGAVLMWSNLQTFMIVLEPATREQLATGTVILGAAALLLAMVGALRARYRGEGRWLWAVALVCITSASVALPVAVRGRGTPPLLEARSLDVDLAPGPPERTARVTIIAVDGGSLDFVTSATAEGRLPNFGRVLDAGAVMRLATLHPTSAEAVWAAVSTGKLPQKNGVRSAGVYRVVRGGADPVQLLPDHCFSHAVMRFGLLEEEPYTATALRTRSVWSILSGAGFNVGVVGWPLTYPAPFVRGYLVSDAYQRLAGTPSGIDDPSTLYPAELQVGVLHMLEEASADMPAAGSTEAALGRHDVAVRSDRTYDRIARTLASERPTQVTAVRYQSLDAGGHYFLRYAVPSEFGDVTDEERRRLGSALQDDYAIIDAAVGRVIAALGPDDLLLVVSGYGMEPLSLPRRMVEKVIGDPDVSGSHDAAPDGFLLAYGPVVAKGRLAARGSVVDVVPTLLYFLGLPVGRDMDGYVRTDVFQRTFTDERPITFIPSYDR